MEKVDEKWLKKNGWTCSVDDIAVDIENEYGKTIRHSVVYEKTIGNFRDAKNYKIARWDHTYIRYYRTNKKGEDIPDGTSNFYEFGCHGDGFSVNMGISYRKFDAEKIKLATKLCGTDE